LLSDLSSDTLTEIFNLLDGDSLLSLFFSGDLKLLNRLVKPGVVRFFGSKNYLPRFGFSMSSIFQIFSHLDRLTLVVPPSLSTYHQRVDWKLEILPKSLRVLKIQDPACYLPFIRCPMKELGFTPRPGIVCEFWLYPFNFHAWQAAYRDLGFQGFFYNVGQVLPLLQELSIVTLSESDTDSTYERLSAEQIRNWLKLAFGPSLEAFECNWILVNDLLHCLPSNVKRITGGKFNWTELSCTLFENRRNSISANGLYAARSRAVQDLEILKQNTMELTHLRMRGALQEIQLSGFSNLISLRLVSIPSEESWLDALSFCCPLLSDFKACIQPEQIGKLPRQLKSLNLKVQLSRFAHPNNLWVPAHFLSLLPSELTRLQIKSTRSGSTPIDENQLLALKIPKVSFLSLPQVVIRDDHLQFLAPSSKSPLHRLRCWLIVKTGYSLPTAENPHPVYITLQDVANAPIKPPKPMLFDLNPKSKYPIVELRHLPDTVTETDSEMDLSRFSARDLPRALTRLPAHYLTNETVVEELPPSLTQIRMSHMICIKFRYLKRLKPSLRFLKAGSLVFDDDETIKEVVLASKEERRFEIPGSFQRFAKSFFSAGNAFIKAHIWSIQFSESSWKLLNPEIETLDCSKTSTFNFPKNFDFEHLPKLHTLLISFSSSNAPLEVIPSNLTSLNMTLPPAVTKERLNQLFVRLSPTLTCLSFGWAFRQCRLSNIVLPPNLKALTLYGMDVSPAHGDLDPLRPLCHLQYLAFKLYLGRPMLVHWRSEEAHMEAIASVLLSKTTITSVSIKAPLLSHVILHVLPPSLTSLINEGKEMLPVWKRALEKRNK
jgi:hypothetical protein